MKLSTECTPRSGDGRFLKNVGQPQGTKSPSNDKNHGTATEPGVADLRPALVVTAADSIMRSAK